MQGKPKPPKKVRLGMREGGALAIAEQAWIARKGWADFDDAREKRAIRALHDKGLVTTREITARGRRGEVLRRTLQAQITPAGLLAVGHSPELEAVPF